MIVTTTSIANKPLYNLLSQHNLNSIISHIEEFEKPDCIINPIGLIEYMENRRLNHLLNIPENLYNPITMENEFTPTIDGITLWEKLPWESPEIYKIFRSYRDKGPTRTLYEISKQFSMLPLEVLKLNKLFSWTRRIQEYDSYNDKVHTYLVSQRQIDIQNNYYNVSKELFSKCFDYCNSNIDSFNPKQVIETMKLAMELSRYAVGEPTEVVKALGKSTIVNVNTNNNLGSQEVVNNLPPADLETDKDRLAGILNIMNKIGAFEQKEQVIEEINPEEVIIE